MIPMILPVAADFSVVAASTNKSNFYVHSSAMTDPQGLVSMSPGDTYQTSNGEKVTIVSLQDFRLNRGGVHKGGKAYTIQDSPEVNRTIIVRVY